MTTSLARGSPRLKKVMGRRGHYPADLFDSLEGAKVRRYSASMAAVIGAKALIPNPALAPLAFLVGRWLTTGTHPLLPDVALEGATEFAWHEGGSFLAMRSQVDDPRIPDGLAFFGSDDSAQTVVMIYFDEREISRIYAVEVAEGRVTWSRDDPQLAQTMTVTRHADGTLTSEGRMSKDGCPWGPDLSQIFRRVV